jgi:hypothetical protein
MDTVSIEKTFGSIARQVYVREFAHAHGRPFTPCLWGVEPNSERVVGHWESEGKKLSSDSTWPAIVPRSSVFLLIYDFKYGCNRHCDWGSRCWTRLVLSFAILPR